MAAKSGEDSLSFAVYLPPDVPMPFVDPLTATGPAVLSLFDESGFVCWPDFAGDR